MEALKNSECRTAHTNPIPDSESNSPAARWRRSVFPISDWSISAVMDKTDPLHTHACPHTSAQTHKCRVEAPVTAVTGWQLGSGPVALWEMALFGPIKVRLFVDTYSYDNCSGGFPSVLFTVYSLSVKLRDSHTLTHTYKLGQLTANFNGHLSCLR